MSNRKICPKICPLMSRPIVDTTSNYAQVILDEIQCKEEACAWWDGDCAIVVISKTLRSPVETKDVTPVQGLL